MIRNHRKRAESQGPAPFLFRKGVVRPMRMSICCAFRENPYSPDFASLLGRDRQAAFFWRPGPAPQAHRGVLAGAAAARILA